MKTTLIVFVALVCLASAAYSLQINDLKFGSAIQRTEFEMYARRHGKTYEPSEVNARFQNFLASKDRIAKLNQEAQRSGSSAKFALNKFSDMSPEEFSRQYKGYRPNTQSKVQIMPATPVEVSADLPTSFDWRSKGAVTPVKNQGQCGSCWAFSATEGVESGWFLAKNQLLELAPQQIVDCDNNDMGCDGGDLPTAFAYVKEKGLEFEKDYPYTSGTSGNGGRCDYKSADVGAHITGFQYATRNKNETEMQEVMMTKGPLSICVDAETWQDYSSGIIKSNCRTSLDHCVQLTGWGEESSVQFWSIRNSWATDWGEQGYIRVERNKDLCGVATEATYVVV